MLRTIPILIMALLLASPLMAQIPEGVEGTYVPHPEAEKATSRLLSPFCPGLMLEQCPAEQSRILRDSLQLMALQGMNAREIEEWMLANHGEEYRAVPQNRGSALAAWVIPPLALLGGIGAVIFVLRHVRPVSSEGASADGDDDDAGVGEGGPAADVLSVDEERRLREAIREIELAEDPAL